MNATQTKVLNCFKFFLFYREHASLAFDERFNFRFGFYFIREKKKKKQNGEELLIKMCALNDSSFYEHLSHPQFSFY